MDADKTRAIVCIEEFSVPLTRDELLDLQILLSTAHGRIIQQMIDCGCMDESTHLSHYLEGIRDAHDRVKQATEQLEATV